jgi:hydrogenase nickel incorporation protein HypB
VHDGPREPERHSEHDHPPSHVVRLERAILAKNDRFAEQNRAYFRARRVLAVNLMSSPGAGKTSLLERAVRDLALDVPVAVIEGDQESENDARRIRATGCAAVQINTGAGCHLDAERVGRAARSLDPSPQSILFIENVGNLVCPAMFDLGESARLAVLSVAEGEDKPIKYPHMFRAADAVVLSKIDLLPHLEFDPDLCVANAKRIRPELEIFPISVRRGVGLAALYAWLRDRLPRLEEEAG